MQYSIKTLTLSLSIAALSLVFMSSTAWAANRDNGEACSRNDHCKSRNCAKLPWRHNGSLRVCAPHGVKCARHNSPYRRTVGQTYFLPLNKRKGPYQAAKCTSSGWKKYSIPGYSCGGSHSDCMGASKCKTTRFYASASTNQESGAAYTKNICVSANKTCPLAGSGGYSAGQTVSYGGRYQWRCTRGGSWIRKEFAKNREQSCSQHHQCISGACREALGSNSNKYCTYPKGCARPNGKAVKNGKHWRWNKKSHTCRDGIWREFKVKTKATGPARRPGRKVKMR